MGRPVACANLAKRSRVGSLTLMVVLIPAVYYIGALFIYRRGVLFPLARQVGHRGEGEREQPRVLVAGSNWAHIGYRFPSWGRSVRPSREDALSWSPCTPSGPVTRSFVCGESAPTCPRELRGVLGAGRRNRGRASIRSPARCGSWLAHWTPWVCRARRMRASSASSI